MTGKFGLRIGETKSVEWGDIRGRGVPVREDPGLVGTHVVLPGYTRLTGRLFVKEGRVYGRFTQAHTPGGDTYPMCLELLDTDNNVGLELEPGSGPGSILVGPVAQVRVVDRFK
jgi:serine/threonine-protein kinase